ncbi:vanomycin resistance protein VanB, partial [Modestobacter muralis]|nr:vanomycin resistance protein VanB [Modestobacter muralis]NEN49618.1 vanomycin resistance protein VanB [Modestobacter muralis]
MPQDPSDTVRLQPDGTIGGNRPGPPPVPTGTPAAPDETQVIGARVPADGPTAEPADADPPHDATQHIAPVTAEAQHLSPARDAAPHDATQHLTPVPGGPPSVPGDGPGGPPSAPAGEDGHWWRRRAVLVPAGAVLALAAVYGVDLLASGDDVPRGTVVAGVELGGLSPASAAARLESDLAPRVAADRTVQAGDVQGMLHPASAGLALDVPATVDAVDDQPLNPLTRLTSLFGDRAADPVLTSDQPALTAQLDQLATTVDRPPVDAS